MKYVFISLGVILLLSALIFALPNRVNNQISEVYQPTVIPMPTKWIPSPTPRPLDSDKLFQLVNSWRTENGYQPYIKSDFACSVVNKRLPEILSHFSHDGFYYQRFCKDCYLAENLVKGYETESDTLNAWINSPDHLRDLKGNYTHSCLKCSGLTCDQTFTYF